MEIKFKLSHNSNEINIFTTRPETIFGASFLALSVEHYLSEKFKNDEKFIKFKKQCLQSQLKGIEDNEKFCFTGLNAKNPLTGEDIPVVFTNYVLMGFGTGAVFGVLLMTKEILNLQKNTALKL